MGKNIFYEMLENTEFLSAGRLGQAELYLKYSIYPDINFSSPMGKADFI